MNILLFVQVSIALLLIIAILLQKTSGNGLGEAGGGMFNSVQQSTNTTFLTKVTVILITLFLINAIILANISSKKNNRLNYKIEQSNNLK